METFARAFFDQVGSYPAAGMGCDALISNNLCERDLALVNAFIDRLINLSAALRTAMLRVRPRLGLRVEGSYGASPTGSN
jgi:hypothetical protein